MKRRIFGLLLVLTLLLALPFAGSAEAAAVTVEMVSEPALTYTETVKFSVNDEDGHPVTDGTVNLWRNVEGSSQCSCPVSNGVAEIQASTLVSKLGLPLGQPTVISSCYLPGSGAYEATIETPLTITVNESTLPAVALTSAGYAYGKPVSGFQLTAPTGVQIGGKRIHDANDAEVTDGTFGAQAYTLWVNLECEEGYKLSEKTAVTLDGKEPLRIEDGFYVFQLDKLVATYRIKYTLDGGTMSGAPETYTENSADITLPQPTKADCRFTGWTGTGLTAPTMEVTIPTGSTGDREYTANWEEIQYFTVFYNVHGHGTAPADEKVESGKTAAKPEDPTADGWKFKGWYRSDDYIGEPFDFTTAITENTTLHAKWARTWTVTFDVGGHGTAPAAQTVEDGAKATKPANPTEKGWRFDGWYTDTRYTTEYTFKEEVTADTVLYAKWTRLYTLTFETNGGTKIDSVEAPEGSLVYLGSYKPTKSGYYFVGWYTDKNLTQASRVSSVKMDADKTVYAKFAVADKTNPKTADPALPGLALAVLSFSTVGLAALGIKKRK